MLFRTEELKKCLETKTQLGEEAGETGARSLEGRQRGSGMKEDLPRVTRSVVQADAGAGEPVGREGWPGVVRLVCLYVCC